MKDIPTTHLLPIEWSAWVLTGDPYKKIPTGCRELSSRICSAVALARTETLNKERKKKDEKLAS